MANPLNQDQLSQIVAAVIQALSVQGTAPKAAPTAQPVDKLAARDRSIISGFRRRGIPLDQIVLMDRSDKSKPYTIKPFKAWLAEGWQVRRGERSVLGLFHQSQCDRIAPKAQPKGKAKAKPAPATLPLV